MLCLNWLLCAKALVFINKAIAELMNNLKKWKVRTKVVFSGGIAADGLSNSKA